MKGTVNIVVIYMVIGERNNMPIIDELRKLVAEQIEIEGKTFTPETSFVEDLGADSLDLIQLIMSIEERFHLEINDEDAEKLVTVQDVVTYLKGRGVTI